MNYTKEFTKIDTAGQWTIIFDGNKSRPSIEEAKALLYEFPKTGQIALISNNKAVPIISMIGDELSVNGTLACCYAISQNRSATLGKVYSLPLKKPLEYKVSQNNIFVDFPTDILIKKSANRIEFHGISYLIESVIPKSKNVSQNQKTMLIQLSINNPASGIIYFENDKIVPLIFVKKTNTYIWETACGSASLAYAIISGKTKIIQPSGQSIEVCKINEGYRISAPTKIIK